ncbi:hypothetical protein PILCRDRAFT_820448 [Piloderma croceum F 1598]|uniref:Uncharacterized protein n=1 Tax=Piloderma croceum (strain F 1598) TaxID=765440 RepID=A0A0C3BYX2_PILCF|nr:hypothetical protein PILCRDRAFT_820448 [Piloderma croceum F 1598]
MDELGYDPEPCTKASRRHALPAKWCYSGRQAKICLPVAIRTDPIIYSSAATEGDECIGRTKFQE